MDRRNFFKNCFYLGCAYALGSYAYRNGKSYFFGNAKKIRDDSLDMDYPNFDIRLAEHCNLSCKYCCYFSNIADFGLLSPEEHKRDLKQLAKVTKGKVRGFQLLGGEPLLNPEINEICKITREIFPNAYIQVMTNGLLLNSMKDDFWQTLKDYSVEIRQSLYPVFKFEDIDKYYEKAEKYGIKTYDTKDELKADLRTRFFRLNLNLEGSGDYKKIYEACEKKYSCFQLYHGKIYHCWITPGIKYFNKKFNQHLDLVEADTLDIYKIKSIDDIWDFLYSPSPFCKYCGAITKDAPWEASPEHDITEWTYKFDKD